MPNNEPRRQFRVPSENLEMLQSQIAHVNRRVAKLQRRGHDLQAVTVQVGQPYVAKDEKGERVYVDVVLLSPEPPKLGGWEFVAALTHVENVGSVLRVCPGAQVSEGELRQYRDASPDNCDHCHASRRRTDTFVVRKTETGELSQVGRQCLEAYTGLTNPEALCRSAEILFSVSDLLSDSEDDDFCGGGGGPRHVTIPYYLPFVCCSIRQHGWLSRTAARERGDASQSTADLAFSNGCYASPANKDRYVPVEKDYNLAAAVVEHCEDYFAEREVESLSDYESSLRVAMASGIAHPKFAGLVASAVGFYQRDLERRAARESWAAIAQKSRFQGAVKERRLFEELRVLAYRTFDGDFSTTHFYTFVDQNSNAYAYPASRDMSLMPGQVVSFVGTVKKHKVYTPKREGSLPVQQTVLTRCGRVVRAKVVSYEVTMVPGPLKALPLAPGESYVRYERPLVKQHEYRLEGADGRRYVAAFKSKKKALVPGVVLAVQFDPERKDEVVPVSLVEVHEQAPKQSELFQGAAS